MKFVRIFGENLVAVKYEDTDTKAKKYVSEWDKIFAQWQDFEYVYNFFNDDRIRRHLTSSFFRQKKLSIQQARLQVMQDALIVRSRILHICASIENGERTSLDEFFRPLVNTEIGNKPLQLSKARKRLIAIYAIRVSSSHYVLTGGAIKLVHEMKDQNETYVQLIRLQTTASYLKSQGVIDAENFYEFIDEEI